MNFSDFTISELHKRLADKKISAKELTQGYIDNIDKYEDLLHAFINVTSDKALAQADIVDSKIKQGNDLTVLTGIPASIKDVIVTKGVICTGGSRILENYMSPYNATVITKLENSDYILLGKNNCDEFAHGASNENSGFGSVQNPWDTTRVPGGSSGGSAATVAAGMSQYALGSDTGGSVRQPAGFCGVVGIKPTYGRVSRYGLMAMTSSLDQIGVLARRVDDVREVLGVIEGEDPLDATSSSAPEEKRVDSLKGIKVGVPREFFIEGLDGGVEVIVKKSIKKLEELGAKIVEINLPHFKYSVATYYIISPAEVSANMARYDGVRYGVSVRDNQQPKINNLDELYKANRSAYLGEEVKRRIMLGTYVLSAGYQEQYYGRAQKVRQLIKDDFAKAFKDVDVIAGPVSPTPAFKLGEKADDPLAMYLSDIYTVPVNLAGLPALSVPAGFVYPEQSREAEAESKKLPVGLHLIGKWWEDNKLLDIAELFETATEYYKERPEL